MSARVVVDLVSQCIDKELPDGAVRTVLLKTQKGKDGCFSAEVGNMSTYPHEAHDVVLESFKLEIFARFIEPAGEVILQLAQSIMDG